MPSGPQSDAERSTLVRPGLALGLAVVVMLVLSLLVVPRIETFFDSFHAKLPLPTRIVVSFSHFMRRSGWLMLAIAVSSILAAVNDFRTPEGQANKDERRLRFRATSDSLGEHHVVERFRRYCGPVVVVFVLVVLAFVVVALVSGFHVVYNQVDLST